MFEKIVTINKPLFEKKGQIIKNLLENDIRADLIQSLPKLSVDAVLNVNF